MDPQARANAWGIGVATLADLKQILTLQISWINQLTDNWNKFVGAETSGMSVGGFDTPSVSVDADEQERLSSERAMKREKKDKIKKKNDYKDTTL